MSLTQLNDENTIEINETSKIDLKTIDLRLNSIKDSIQRSRFVLIVMTIACSAILFTIWNANFSRERSMAFVNPGDGSSIESIGRRTLIEDWYKSRSIKVGLLGVQVDVGDFSLVGSFALVIITIWYFYSQRQVNKEIVNLLENVKSGTTTKFDNSFYKYIYHGIAQNALFSTIEPPKSAGVLKNSGIDNDETNSEIISDTNIKEDQDKLSTEIGVEDTNTKQDDNNKSLYFLLIRIILVIAFLISSPFVLFLLLIKISIFIDYEKSRSMPIVFSFVLMYLILIMWIFVKWLVSNKKILTHRILKDDDRAKWGLGLIKNVPIRKSSLSNSVINFLEHLPFWTILAIIFRDIINLCMVSPTRGKTLIELPALLNSFSPFFSDYGMPIGVDIISQLCNGYAYPLAFVLLFDGFAVVCAIYCKILCDECIHFTNANVATLNKFIQS